MASLIEDHGMIGDLHTAALVGKDGTIDFLCLPDFDSDASFASLLGTEQNGFWRIAPVGEIRSVARRYRDKTLILETDFATDDGVVRIVDFMPVRSGPPHVVRWVEGITGTVKVRFELKPCFANGYTIPKVREREGAMSAFAGPDAVYLRGGKGGGAPPFEAEITVSAGERIPFVLSWARPYHDIPAPLDADAALHETEEFWVQWASKLQLPESHQDLVLRSLITLKACTYRPSGGIVAAPTFGLPETPGGERNWDYRFTWLRDSVLTLSALLKAGLLDEVRDFGTWVNDAFAGNPEQLQIMYGIRGERRLTEVTLPWLAGYGGAKPVRIGNGAYDQFQLDVLGECAHVMQLYVHALGHLPEQTRENFGLLAHRVSQVWKHQDHGIWEMRGPKQDFTASKVAAWTAIDRWVQIIEDFGLDEDKDKWIALRQEIFDDIVTNGYDPVRNTFTQTYGGKGLDASLLFIPLSGFLPADDPRVIGTIKAIEEDLVEGGFVLRYRTDGLDGLSGEEGVFLACSFWLADCYELMGRHDEARLLFERLADLTNDVGLLAEEYLPSHKQQIGNFPQAFSHLALVNSAYTLFAGAPTVQSTHELPTPVEEVPAP